jgi:hypothetical protein
MELMWRRIHIDITMHIFTTAEGWSCVKYKRRVRVTLTLCQHAICLFMEFLEAFSYETPYTSTLLRSTLRVSECWAGMFFFFFIVAHWHESHQGCSDLVTKSANFKYWFGHCVLHHAYVWYTYDRVSIIVTSPRFPWTLELGPKMFAAGP